MAIRLTDYIHAATVKGKIADAAQIFLNGDEENVQQAIDRLNALEGAGGALDSIVNVANLHEGSIIENDGSSCIYIYNSYPAYSFPYVYNGATSMFVYVNVSDNEEQQIRKAYIITGRTVAKIYEDDIPEWVYSVMPDTIAQKILEIEQELKWK